MTPEEQAAYARGRADERAEVVAHLTKVHTQARMTHELTGVEFPRITGAVAESLALAIRAGQHLELGDA